MASDSGWLVFWGVVAGGVVSTLTTVVQARSAARVEQRRLEHERDLALQAQRDAATQAREERHRAALAALTEHAALLPMRSSGGFQSSEWLQMRGLAGQIDDPHLHLLIDELAEPDEIIDRIGYLLRTPEAQWTQPP